jgi:hypothetical protein
MQILWRLGSESVRPVGVSSKPFDGQAVCGPKEPTGPGVEE